MRILYGKNHTLGGNLGDELNNYLWPKLFKNVFNDRDDSTPFMGIGSILSADSTYNRSWISSNSKIIFGTGVRPYHKRLIIDDTYDIYFLRGPLSAMYLGVNNNYVITDAAYCLQFIEEFNDITRIKKTDEIGIIPHFQSMRYINWDMVANQLGYKLISPICCVEDIPVRIADIAKCKYVLCEAMHGAILADIVRVPWTRFVFGTFRNESQAVSEFKWMDWLFSMDIKYPDYLYLPLTTRLNNGISKISNGNLIINTVFRKQITNSTIDKIACWAPQLTLSSDSILDKRNAQLFNKIVDFNNKYANSLRTLP